MIKFKAIATNCLAICLFTCIPSVGNSADESEKAAISYYRDVKPIFMQNCQGCHQPAKAQGGYIMTDYASLLKAGESGKPAITPNDPAKSYLMNEIRVVSGKHEMPKNRDALSPKQVTTIENWILQGAKDDTPASAKAPSYSINNPPSYSAAPVVTSLAFHPNGKTLAVSGYHEILMYSADGKKLLSRFIGESERIQSIAFSPDGSKLAAVGGSPGRFGEVQIWDVEKEKLTISVPVTADTLYGVSWAPDSSMVAFGCTDFTLRGIDPKTGNQTLQMGTHADWILGTVFSRDSKHLASVSRDMTMKLTEVQTQRFIDNVTSITPGALKGGLMAVAIAPKTKKWFQKLPSDTPGIPRQIYDELIFGGSDGIPRRYKMHREAKREIGDDSNKIKLYAAMPGRISSIVMTSKGDHFAAASSLDGQGQVWIYAVNSDEVVKCEKITGPTYTVAIQPGDKTIASAGFDGTVWLHDLKTGKLVSQFQVMPTKVAAK